MGKSSKKVRNDRINSIRKQYDAFLEEDKKRRERNEYILGKLDKMRSPTALVPISSSANHYVRHSPDIYLRPHNQITKAVRVDSYIPHLERQNFKLGTLSKHDDELSILKEISKKYILIPKRRTAIESDYIYNQNDVEDDWRSKYNILDDLKRLEKESQPDPILNQSNNNLLNREYKLSQGLNIPEKAPPNSDTDNRFKDEAISDKNHKFVVENKLMKHLEDQNDINKNINIDDYETNNHVGENNKVPIQIASLASNQDMSVDPTQPFYNTAQEFIVEPHQEFVTEKEKYNSETNEKDINLTQNLNNNLQTYDINNSVPVDYQENVHESDYYISTEETNNFKPEDNNKADTSNSNITEQTLSDENQLVCSPDKHPEEPVNLNMNPDNNQEVGSENKDLTPTEGVVYHVDPESETNSNKISFETDHDTAQETIPFVIQNIENPDHVEHESEINAFEAEQKEMFYSEQAGAETFIYNQDNDNTGDYAGGYEQNEQYAYYEGVQQEQGYATNIGETEDSTERYDPHYNEQYEGSYENQQPDNTVNYENTNTYEQQQYQNENAQFENVVNYENQQDNVYQQETTYAENEVQENILAPQDDKMYDQHLYTVQPESQEHIEQQLLTEEGYIESTPVVANAFREFNEDQRENVLNTNPAEESTPDPK